LGSYGRGVFIRRCVDGEERGEVCVPRSVVAIERR
jgi:hypothetical protein